jgi:hypothetical protein
MTPRTQPLFVILLLASTGCAAMMPGATSRASANAVAINRAQLGRPIVVETPSVSWTTPLATLIGESGARNTACHTRTTAAPIASFRIEEPIDDLLITVQPKEGHTEFFVIRDSRYWQQCNGYTMSQPATEWTPGRYDIYPTSGDGAFTVTFSSERALAAGAGASGGTKIVIDEKLVKPKLVTLKGRRDRAFLPASVAGKNCDSFAMPNDPDFSIEVKTMESVLVRRLPTKSDVILGIGTRAARYCLDKQRQPTELRLTAEAGVTHYSIGSERAESTPEVTLLISDKHTEFDQLALHPFGGDNPAIADRDIHAHFPQLQLRHERGTTTWAQQAMLAQLFAAAPRGIWVYASTELTLESTTIAAGEPLLIWNHANNVADVVTLDGMIGQVRSVGLSTTAPSAITWPTRPRELRKHSDGDLVALLPPGDAPVAQAMLADVARWDACRDAAFAPFAARLPVAPAGFEIIKNDAYLRIEHAGHVAQDKQCSTAAAFEAKKLAPQRTKIWALITKARTKLLADLVATLGKN